MIRSFVTVSSGTLASRLLGFVRDSMVAALLGAGPVADAFLAALPVSRLWGVGTKTEQTLHRLGIRLIGDIAAREPDRLERHLEHCEICSAILDSTRNILILTADKRTFEVPVGFSEKLHRRLEEEIKQQRKPDEN